MLDANIKFFDIKHCGFYLRGRNFSEFSSLNDILQKLSSWSRDGREFINTSTYEPDPDNDINNTYFCNSYRSASTGDSVLILWNEVPNDNGVIYGINPTDRPGNNSMLTTRFRNSHAIPGFPSYFWFVPERDVFASVCFKHSVQGKGKLDLYLNGYMENKTPYRVLGQEDAVIGYSDNGQVTEISSKIHPKFHSVGRKQEELEAELLANRHKIRKFIKREKLLYRVPDNRYFIERLFSGLLSNPPDFEQARVISQEFHFEPTEQQLRQIIGNYTEQNHVGSTSKVGFVYNDGKRIMLSGINVAFSVNIDVNRDENQIIDPQSLLQQLTLQRQDLLCSLDQAGFDVE